MARDLFTLSDGAAQYLDRWLRDGSIEPQAVLFSPGEVVERQSTQMFGDPDPVVRRALVLIHTPAVRPLNRGSTARSAASIRLAKHHLLVQMYGVIT
ncbi:MAG: hypothetical protein WD534_10970 [Phycisphaeraceae bacterium]